MVTDQRNATICGIIRCRPACTHQSGHSPAPSARWLSVIAAIELLNSLLLSIAPGTPTFVTTGDEIGMGEQLSSLGDRDGVPYPHAVGCHRRAMAAFLQRDPASLVLRPINGPV